MRPNKALWIVGLTVALVGVAATTSAEISASADELPTDYLVSAITEGPDPIPHGAWQAWDEGVPDDTVLNADGAEREDGRPDLAIDATTGRPLVVWAYNLGSDHDIALGAWDGVRWTTEFLTWSTADEVDPRVFVDEDGAVYVTWWETDLERVLLVSRPAELWSQPVEVEVAGRRPSVLVLAGEVWVAFERDAPGGGQDVVVARAPSIAASFSYQVVTATERTEALDVLLHAADGHVWIDFKSDDEELTYSESIGATWTTPGTVSSADRSWLGVETLRKVARRIVLSP